MILSDLSNHNYIFKHTPHLFTEYGVAMLSSVLRSRSAIQINISIMRTFTKLKSYLAMDSSNGDKINELEESTSKLFKVVFERLDNLENQVSPRLEQNRKRLELKIRNKLLYNEIIC